ncbi:Rrf2 family transcriptional regulator [Campylobacter curvus]|uniref:Rrf2 family transcriptional regulator n=1 Tax=Campylobacter curvus TaxID=200 RepID=UPI000376EB33|nr:Rrf2 family transcriptional regulator [Campylobacter curvus]QKF61718.1 transcriptional regulator, IscR/Rrf2 family [Campylobacter curvus]UEB50015.1 Rrf2 family transcriptional regulator [Campylobacter curvus]
MQVGIKFSVSIHILLSAEFFKDEKVTSEFIADSVGTNPVIIRKLTQLLKKAGLLEVRAGVGGVNLAKKPGQITLFDVYQAVSDDEKNLFKIHAKSPAACPLGGKIENLLNSHFISAQNAMQKELGKVNLQDLLDELKA